MEINRGKPVKLKKNLFSDFFYFTGLKRKELKITVAVTASHDQ